ncbi:FAD-dependent oxidoreductase [Streptomyces sp. 71268]|uniref:NAD(P)/FAD-dependent oxidoreductase n=1 Tax=Streptomyces sp. 71268 TaxID=3002640 RepID=UPI0023FA385F|nr:FAD-dependent oxidoreductase [Streptomyces sp. 71268]WEV23796.1 FAD-dependent oxidoreductase [Streptomyces sp. 71268]
MRAPIVVVGASLAGLRAAEQLRAVGWEGPITLVGDEPHPPYNRPPLSKAFLAGTASPASLTLRPRASLADATWLLGTRAVRADLDRRTVDLADGRVLPYRALVIATGTRPRRLTCPGPSVGRHTLRTIADARRLRAALAEPGARVVVVGAGFIGCEVAATVSTLGAADVTVVDPLPLPMLGPLGESLATELRHRHERRGVRFALGRHVTGFAGRDRVTGVRLDDGSTLAADVVVESVGSLANTEWLAGNGLDLTDGVLTDTHLRVGGRPDVVAVGDIARFPGLRYDGVPRRVEHWSIPTDTARHAARVLAAHLADAEAGAPAGAGPVRANNGAGADLATRTDMGTAVGGELAPFAPLPTFWSDQHDFRLQSFGAPALGTADARVLYGEPSRDVVGYHQGGRLVGVVALGGQAAVAVAARHRATLLQQSPTT